MINTESTYLVILIAGVALFLYGLSLASQSLEKIMATKISALMNKVSQSQFLAINVGILLTTLMQSSGAVTSMLVSLGSARVVTLRQVMGVIIGTAIGSTLTVQLISLDIAHYALPIFIFGFAIYFKSKKAPFRNIGLSIMGFGLLFLGLKFISQSSQFFVENPLMVDVLSIVRGNWTYSLTISTLFCIMVQSSAVTVGLAMSLASAGAISLHDAMVWVYGANLGTTSVALIAAANSNHVGKQVAWAHLFYKLMSVIIFAPFTYYLEDFLNIFGASVGRSVANWHMFFNIFSAILFYPFINKGADLIERFFQPDPKENFGTKFVTLNTYQSSALAISYAQREIMRTADLVLSMIRDSVKLFERVDPAVIESIKERDNRVDLLYRETKMFLLDHANKGNSAVNQNIMNMIMFLSDLERAADAIDINMVALAIKKNALRLEFSPEGFEEIKSMHEQVYKVATMAVNSYQSKELCDEAIQLKRDLAKIETQMRENHILRLNKGMRESINTSSIHLDLLSEYRRIASLLCNHAYTNVPGKVKGEG